MTIADQVCFVWAVIPSEDDYVFPLDFTAWLVANAPSFGTLDAEVLYSRLDTVGKRSLLNYLSFWDTTDAIVDHIAQMNRAADSGVFATPSPYNYIVRAFLATAAAMNLAEITALARLVGALRGRLQQSQSHKRSQTLSSLYHDTERGASTPQTHHHPPHATSTLQPEASLRPSRSFDELMMLALNAERTEEYTLAKATWARLYDFYGSSIVNTSLPEDGAARASGPQSALLARVQLEHRSNHPELSLQLLKEAIDHAQRLGDETSLLHCLAWLAVTATDHVKAINMLQRLLAKEQDDVLRCKAVAELSLRQWLNGDGLSTALATLDRASLNRAGVKQHDYGVVIAVRACLYSMAGQTQRARTELKLSASLNTRLPVLVWTQAMASWIRLEYLAGQQSRAIDILAQLETHQVPGYVRQADMIAWIRHWVDWQQAYQAQDTEGTRACVQALEVLVVKQPSLCYEYELLSVQTMRLQGQAAQVEAKLLQLHDDCLQATREKPTEHAVRAVECLRQVIRMRIELYTRAGLVSKAKELREWTLEWATSLDLASLVQCMQAHYEMSEEDEHSNHLGVYDGTYDEKQAICTTRIQMARHGENAKASLTENIRSLRALLACKQGRLSPKDKQAHTLLAKACHDSDKIDQRNAHAQAALDGLK
eukprot:TRINITY_DN11473_c0_g2_i1.p1 TRINITY_DN11473_c0_g2~~TRINITY_DN11473_c0_g2_i1.p1  ORF type:complete len:655 (+),score=154.70 TRINITY_DN11473_c0_g2_i1:167-2131(+)